MTPDGKVTRLASFNRDTTDGQYPAGPLVEGMTADGTPNGVFYGMTVQGGDSNKGTIYMLAPDAGSATAYFISYLYAFTGGTDGGSPQGGLILGRKADGTPDGYVSSRQCQVTYSLENCMRIQRVRRSIKLWVLGAA